ncbi:MAG: alcohol dehydrogenase catalytic domain-containing protein [Planctomycetota bacterium]
MKAACFRDVETVAVDSIPLPRIEAPSDAIVEVKLAGLCGSDLHPFFGREAGLQPGTVMGHEFVGVVTEIGGEVATLAVGDSVCAPFTTNCGTCFYCNCGLTSRCPHGQLFGWRQSDHGLHGGQAQYVRVPLADGTLMKVPPGFSDDAALLLGDNLSTAFFAASLAIDEDEISAKQSVLAVVGCGNVGLLGIVAAKQRGVAQVFAIDPNESRLRLAERLGATVFEDPRAAINAVSKATDGRGADAVMEFVGLPDAQRLAYDLVRPGGRVSVIGCHCTPHFAFSPAEAYDKNLTYRTGRCPARHFMNTLPERIDPNELDLSWCITHRFAIDDAIEAYETFAYRRNGCIKAVLEF